MEPLAVAVLVLLIFAIIGIIVVGCMFLQVQGKEGPQGDTGPRGTPGEPIPPVMGHFLQSGSGAAELSTASVVQNGATVTVFIAGTVASEAWTVNTSQNLGTVQGVQLPNTTVSVVVWQSTDNLYAPAVLNASNGHLTIGPLPEPWIIDHMFSFTLVYVV